MNLDKCLKIIMNLIIYLSFILNIIQLIYILYDECN